MREPQQPRRRTFLKAAALGGLSAGGAAAQEARPGESTTAAASDQRRPVTYPRTFTGRNLAMIAFPLGGVAAGSISLGGRGQLRDWEIFNHPDKGRAPSYAFPSIWARRGGGTSQARVLEARLQPPYEAASGLGPANAPGLQRFASATFTGEYPLARVQFRDATFPVRVTLEAFTPLAPHDEEDSGLPAALLRYRVANPGTEKAEVSLAWSIDNPVGDQRTQRVNEFRVGDGLAGLLMHNPGLADDDPLKGSFALCLREPGDAKVIHLTGWPRAKWWASPLLFWDDFSDDGEFGAAAAERTAVGTVGLKREIAAGGEGEFTFVLAWHFPNRTPAGCGWNAPKGEEHAVIGNHYCQRFPDAWKAAEYAAGNLPRLEKRMRVFLSAMRETTLPAAVKEAAMANLSTLATNTSFRTADGKFRGFEGCSNHAGCCYGTCTHVWNYESATDFLFPGIARSMRETAFELSARLGGAMPIRVMLPEGKQDGGLSAADGTMGQVIKTYFDWQLSGDEAWLARMWPKAKQALEFAWTPGGWDADRDGVMEGAQHNTYDVEFYGPNPMCGIYYLGALRAGEEMARAAGDTAAADDYRRLFEKGRRWIDANLFNGEYYVQKIQGIAPGKIAQGLRSDMGTDDPEHPDFQMGAGCLVDQLVGQHVAEYAGLGPLVDAGHIRKTLESIYRYNYKRTLYTHDSLQRVFALNDEAALVICDYGKAARPKIPFPYFAEVMTGFEYSAAVLMLSYGMVREGIECIENIRQRYDGERRNPWDEAECGHHYARAMASWTAIPALGGFRYHGPSKALAVVPKVNAERFRSFWATATGWGTLALRGQAGKMRFSLEAASGSLAVQSVELPPGEGSAAARLGGRAVAAERRRGRIVLAEAVTVREDEPLVITA